MPIDSVRPCPGCGRNDPERVGATGGFELERCRSCRTLFTARLPDVVDYDDYYHEGNLAVPEFVHARLRELAAGFDRYRASGRWLDVGCGAGTLLEAVRASGWEAVGTEVSSGAAAQLQARGLDVRAGDLTELDLGAGEFDVVSMVEVLEHVPHPFAQVDRARELLRPGGALYATTPHGRGISARVLGVDWSVVAPPEHLQLLSVPGIRALAERAGLRVRKLQTHVVNPSELIAHWRRRPADPLGGTQRVESSYRLNEELTSRRGGAAARRAANGLLAATRLGDSLRLLAERPTTPRA